MMLAAGDETAQAFARAVSWAILAAWGGMIEQA
jgi:hypothetical protein